MSEFRAVRSIGSYTLSIDDAGTLLIQSAQLHDPLLFEATQVQEILQWLSEQKKLSSSEVSKAPAALEPAIVPVVESSEAAALRMINETITHTRASYPASLDVENRDRFIDQITRDPAIKPLVSQGTISRKQIMLWVEQSLGANTPSPWTQDQEKKRGRR